MTKEVMSRADRKNNESLFLPLFLVHQKSLYAFILALVHDYVDADDILQETSVIMWQKFAEYQQGTDFIAWGITIARYQVLRHFKEKSRSKMQFNGDLLHAITECTTSQLDSIDKRLKALRHCRNKLNEQDRTLVEMRYDFGIPFKQIAQKTGRSIHVIYKKMSRIQSALLMCIDQALNKELISE